MLVNRLHHPLLHDATRMWAMDVKHEGTSFGTNYQILKHFFQPITVITHLTKIYTCRNTEIFSAVAPSNNSP